MMIVEEKDQRQNLFIQVMPVMKLWDGTSQPVILL